MNKVGLFSLQTHRDYPQSEKNKYKKFRAAVLIKNNHITLNNNLINSNKYNITLYF